jgi:TPR repeat protein
MKIKVIFKVTESGDVESQVEVGEYLRDGKGVRKNRIKARVSLQKVADQGIKDAQKALETLHLAKHGPDPLSTCYGNAITRNDEKYSQRRCRMSPRLLRFIYLFSLRHDE